MIYDIPIVFSHVGVGLKGSASFLKEQTKWAPNAQIIDRASVNAWKEPEFVAAVKALGCKKLIMGGLRTDVCLAEPAIEAAKAGYEVLVPEDTAGSISASSHGSGRRKTDHLERRPGRAAARSCALGRREESNPHFYGVSVPHGPDKEWK